MTERRSRMPSLHAFAAEGDGDGIRREIGKDAAGVNESHGRVRATRRDETRSYPASPARFGNDRSFVSRPPRPSSPPTFPASSPPTPNPQTIATRRIDRR